MSSGGTSEKWGCFYFGVKTGINSLIKGNYLIGLKQSLFPVSYWRFPVFNIALANIELKKHLRILDIGSPKLLSLYLAIKHGHTVFATDLQDQEIFSRFHQHFLDHDSKGANGYIVEYQDARTLKYSDEYFDIVYSISVFEHIPDNGDKEAAREVGRVLKSNGKAIIEVPFSNSPRSEYLCENVYDRKYSREPVFYQRQYDKNSVFSRLVNESGLKLEKAIITRERMPFEKYWSRVPKYFRIPFLWMEPLFSSVNHHSFSLESSREMNKKRITSDKGMNITLVLRKG